MRLRLVVISVFAIVLLGAGANAQTGLIVSNSYLRPSSAQVVNLTVDVPGHGNASSTPSRVDRSKSTSGGGLGAGAWWAIGGGIIAANEAPVPRGKVNLPAGSTIRLRFVSANNRGHMLSETVRPFVAQVPCEGAPSTRTMTGISTATLTASGSSIDPYYEWKTDKSWQGSCRLLVLTLRDGSENRAGRTYTFAGWAHFESSY